MVAGGARVILFKKNPNLEDLGGGQVGSGGEGVY